MNGTIVRIEQVEIRNFKNTHKPYKDSVVGLYG